MFLAEAAHRASQVEDARWVIAGLEEVAAITASWATWSSCGESFAHA